MRLSDWSSALCSSGLPPGRLVAPDQHIGTVDDAHRRLAEAKTGLEVRVAGQMKSVVSLYQASRAIDRLAPGEVLTGVDQSEERRVGTASVSTCRSRWSPSH